MTPQAIAESRETVAVEARGIEYRYGTRQALAGIDFSVPAARIFGFLGPNGGGKTTLFEILSTLRRPDSGSVSIFGVDVVRRPNQARPLLGVVFQHPSLDGHLTIQENLIHQGHLYSLRGRRLRSRIDRLLESFGLAKRRRDRVATLSGGLQRRAEIIKALLHEPRLLVLDEPSSGLDPGARRDLWGILEELRKGGNTTVLLTTHFIEEADRCSRIGLIDAGRLIALGRPEDLKCEIGGDVIQVQVEEPQSFAEMVHSSFGVACTVTEGRVRFEHPEAQELIGRLLTTDPGRIKALTISKPTLEDVFLRRTGHGLGREG